jgi:hypothetical protein
MKIHQREEELTLLLAAQTPLSHAAIRREAIPRANQEGYFGWSPRSLLIPGWNERH